MKRLLFLMLTIVMTVGLFGCSQPASGELLKSDKARITSPVVDQSDMTTLVNGDSEFAFDLYQALNKEDGNIFYSPYSISLALAMTYAGARGETAQQMADTLHYQLDQSALHSAFNNLGIELEKCGEGAKGKDEKGFRLNIVNAIWGQKGYKFLSNYLDLLAENYGAGLRVLDFIKNPNQSREVINQWVSDQTEGRIKDLIPEGSITPLTRLVLTNAIYFNAAWALPFKPDATLNGPFHLISGTDVTAAMMKQTGSFKYSEGDNYQVIELPYDGQELSMVIFLPAPGQFTAFEEAMTYQLISNILAQKNGNQYIALTMPKFEFESEFGLKETLMTMGMVEPFLDTADFSGMSSQSDLHIDDVVHKAFVSVDEAGTEAAAASAVIVGTTSMPPEPMTLTLDRPFVFLIRDIQTGTILFIGRVMNPGE
jgi:serpin B